jgi:hypothetical protein
MISLSAHWDRLWPARERRHDEPFLPYGFCPMESASKFDNRESLAIPLDHLLAIILDPDQQQGMVKVLNHSGFAPDDIGVLTGPGGCRETRCGLW